MTTTLTLTEWQPAAPQQETAQTRPSAHEAEPDDSSRETDLYKWVVVVAAASILFVGVGITNTFGEFQDYYQTNLFRDEPQAKIIIIGSVASSLYLIFGAFTGRFADLVGPQISIAVGASLMVGCLFGASVSRQYYQLFLSQGLGFGLGLAFAYPPATTVSRQYFGSQKYGLANGIVVSGGAVGGCVLPYSVRVSLQAYGLAQTFRTLGYVAIGLLLPSIFLVKPKTKRPAMTAGHRPPILDLSLLSNPHFLALMVSGTVGMIGFLPRYFLIPSSAAYQGISRAYTPWLLGLMNGLSIIGRVGIGSIADRGGKVATLSASFMLCGLGHFVFWLPAVTLTAKGNSTTTTGLFTSFVIYTGLFGSGFVSLFPVVVSHLFGSTALASKAGLLNTALGIGTLAGPSAVYTIVGSGADRHWTAGVLTAGLFMAVGGIFMALFVGQSSVFRRLRGPQSYRDY